MFNRDRESHVTDSNNGGSDKKPGEFKFRPVLLKGESKIEFAALVEDLNRDVQPKQFIERMYVNDIANLTWEIIRLRRFKTTLINNRFHRALASILRQILFPPGTASADTVLAPDRLAYEWLTSQETKERVSGLLQEAGLDDSSVEAEAFRLSLPDTENIDRLLASAEPAARKPFAPWPCTRKASPENFSRLLTGCWQLILRPVSRIRARRVDVASERQLTANRSNAQKSTGPWSASGRRRSSQNAHRHGLTKRLTGQLFERQIELLARRIVGDDTEHLPLARVVAEADLELMRIRQLKKTMIEHVMAHSVFDGSQSLRSQNDSIRQTGCEPDRPPWPILFDPRQTIPKEGADRLVEAIRRLLPDLVKLIRYEDRAAGRRNKAISKLRSKKAI